MSHTPGPWERVGWFVRTPFDINKGGGHIIASAEKSPLGDDVIPNVRLMAAAPEMLAALEAMVGSEPNCFELGRLAIAKAKGDAQ